MSKEQTQETQKFPTEVIDLPSGGKVYPEGSPLRSGQIELKYMTAKEEDILTSQNLIKKGIVLDKLLTSLIVDKSINIDDLILGDKNAVLVAARILAYGPEYVTEVTNPNTNEKHSVEFNLADCPFKNVPDDKINSNEFSLELPVCKANITFKLLTGVEEKQIINELKSKKKLGGNISTEMTTRLRYCLTSVNGDSDIQTINSFVENLLSRDSLFLRKQMTAVAPDIDMIQEVEMEGEMVEVDIPLTIEFFWPTA